MGSEVQSLQDIVFWLGQNLIDMDFLYTVTLYVI